MSEATETPTSVSGVIDQRRDAAKHYRIITANEDIIQKTGEQIVKACQLEMSMSAWRDNFGLTVDHVYQWAVSKSASISLVLVELRSDKTVFYIVPAADQYDFELGMQQADLEIYLNTQGGIGYSESRQIPGWEIDRFVGAAFRVYPKD